MVVGEMAATFKSQLEESTASQAREIQQLREENAHISPPPGLPAPALHVHDAPLSVARAV